MRRRDFINSAILLLSGATSTYAIDARKSLSTLENKNILMISVDDLNGWIGPLGGYPSVRTPALDKLASLGVSFSNAYCSVPACNPSRTAVLTGLPPTTSGVYRNSEQWRSFIPDAITLPRTLKDYGYWTAAFGKIFHVRSVSEASEWDDVSAWDERSYRQKSPLPPSDTLPLNGLDTFWHRTGKFDWGPIDVPVEEMDDHKQVDLALAAISQEHDRPFFVACGIYRPHLPWYVPRQFFDQYPLEDIELPVVLEDDLDDVPRRGRSMANQREHRRVVRSGQWKHAVRAYLASISYADYEVGRLLDGLQKSGKQDDTIVVLWSDHGWHLGPKNHWRKFTLWEEATKSVLMFSGPGIAKNSSCDRVVSLIDIYSTLSELVGFSLPSPDIAGNSLLPLLVSPESSWDKPAISTYNRGNHSIRLGKYRYTRYADGGEELYDLENDPQEWVNLANNKDDDVRDIISELSKFLPVEQAKSIESWPQEPTWITALDGRRYLYSGDEDFLS